MTEPSASFAETTETAAIAELRPHPENYRSHPPDQLEHLRRSIEDHGFYRNIVVTRDGTILAGHGVVEAAKELGYDQVPVIRLDIDPDSPAATKILVGDNELARLGVIDDRALSELLKTIYDEDEEAGLLGTGFSDEALANLITVTRPAGEIPDFNAAAEWIGMPSFDAVKLVKLVITFDDEAGREEFVKELGLDGGTRAFGEGTWAARWPIRPRNDPASFRFEQ